MCILVCICLLLKHDQSTAQVLSQYKYKNCQVCSKIPKTVPTPSILSCMHHDTTQGTQRLYCVPSGEIFEAFNDQNLQSNQIFNQNLPYLGPFHFPFWKIHGI